MVRVSTGIIQCRTLYAWLFTLLYLLWIKRGLVSLDECLTCSSTDAAAMHQFSLLLCLITLPHTANVAVCLFQMNLLLKEYLISGDVSEAEHCLRDLEVPHFHHELVYEVSTAFYLFKSSEVKQSRRFFFFYLFFTHNRIGIKICKLSLFFFFLSVFCLWCRVK